MTRDTPLEPGLYVARDPRVWVNRRDVDWSQPFTVIGLYRDDPEVLPRDCHQYSILSSSGAVVMGCVYASSVRRIV